MKIINKNIKEKVYKSLLKETDLLIRSNIIKRKNFKNIEKIIAFRILKKFIAIIHRRNDK